jgi:hypothetical protein
VVCRLDFGDQIRDVFRLRAYSGAHVTPCTACDRKVVIVIFVVERVNRVELRQRRADFGISV